MARLELRFLGQPEVRYDQQVVTFATRKALALLVYLAVEGGTHSREKLTAFFWPESDSERGRAALRRTLVHLHNALPVSPLRIERDSLAFDSTFEVSLDVRELGSASRAAPAALPDIARLYRGDFLEGFSLPDAPAFDDWASLQRETCHRQMDSLFDRLAQWQWESGALAEAIETTTRWVAHHPLNEAAHRQLMQLHFAAGDRVAALRTYAACCEILARELNAEPVPETNVLAQRLRTQSPPPRESRHTDDEPVLPLITVEGPLVGRAAEHGALVAAFRAARRGTPRLVTLEGEPGIGKTRLAKEFLRWAAAQGATVWQGRAFESGGRVPYQPMIDALRRAGVQALVTSLAPAWVSELQWLLPELRSGGSAPTPDTLTPLASESRTQLFEAIAQLGLACLARAPLVLFIDDGQWADPASLDVLRYLARRWTEAHGPVLFLFGLRSDDLSTTPGRADWLAALGRELPLDRLALGPLTEDDLLQLLEPFDVGDLKAHLGRRLFADTAGQPLFIVEMLKSLFEAASGGWEAEVVPRLRDYALEPAARPIPPGIRAVIQQRLIYLSGSATSALTAAAVLGHGFNFESLRAVADLTEGDGLNALDELLARRLLRESEAAMYTFTHDKIREVVYGGASEARRRIFHRHAGEVLERQFDQRDDAAATIAHHYWQAGEWARAARHSLRAGEVAMRLYAPREANAHYARAIEALETVLKMLEARVLAGVPNREDAVGEPLRNILLDQSSIDPPDQLVEALLGWVRSGFRFQPVPEMLARLARAEKLARQANDLPHLAQALHWIASVHMANGFPSHAMPALMECYQLAAAVGDERLSIIPSFYLSFFMVDRNPRAALAQCDHVLDLTRKHHHREFEAHTLATQALAHARLGEAALALQAMRSAREVMSGVASPIKEADIILLAAMAHYDMGDMPQCLAYGQESAHKALAAHAIECACGAYFFMGMGQLQTARCAEAAAAFEESLRLAQVSGAPPFLNFGRGGLAAAQFFCGQTDAVAGLENALTVAQTMSDDYGAALFAQVLGEAHARLGHLERAEACWRSALDYYRRAEMRPHLARGLNALAQFYQQQNRHADAEHARREAGALGQALNGDALNRRVTG